MRRILLVSAFFCCSLAVRAQAPARIDVLHYELNVEVDPENHALKGQANIRVRLSEPARNIPFEIHNRFSLSDVTDEGGKQLPTRFDENNNNRFFVTTEGNFPAGEKTLRMSYEGVLERESSGIFDRSRVMNGYVDEGRAYMMYSARWFPMHDPLFDPATARVTVTVPHNFVPVVAGVPQPARAAGNKDVFVWELRQPSSQLSLVVAKLKQHNSNAENVPLHLFLSDAQTSRADAIAQQISAVFTYFQRTVGSYPFGHLSAVEIADDVRDELGAPGVIYLPSLLLKSPKLSDAELARRVALQWWGLGAMPATRNDMLLADGIAYYEAALYLESKDKDAAKDEILKLAVLALKYESRSPISNAYTLGFRGEEYESIVAGKGAWIFHMLEDLLGREKVTSALREIAVRNMGKQVPLSQLQSALAAGSDKDLKGFFAQWVESTGIPELDVDYTVFKQADGTFRVAGTVRQNLELFQMPLQVAVETKNKREVTTVQVTGKNTKFDIRTAERPVKVIPDPDQKLLRNSTEMEVSVHIALGYEFFQRNQFLEAIREYERATKLNPRSSMAHYRLGEVFFEQFNTNSAGQAFRDALNGDLQPKWVEPLSRLHLGMIFDMLNERQRALAEYQKVINAKDNSFGAVDQAEQYSKEPFTKKTTIMDKEDK
ncbi:MAG TPA: tetratricopeptide repeat protein [Acidobacteriota bacterium]|jgi:aminopeptidase N